jgi:hypothetical protein
MADPNYKKKPFVAVTDPLEASKIQSKPAPPPPPPQMDLTPAPIVPDAVREVPMDRYRVTATKMLSIHGQITRLNVGDVISEQTHGPAAMEKILGSDVPLTKLAD